MKARQGNYSPQVLFSLWRVKPFAHTREGLEDVALGELIKTRKTNIPCSHSYMEAKK